MLTGPTTNSLLTSPTTEPQITASNTILVKGLKDCHTELVLKLFFTNKKKCGGGDVTKILLKKDNAYVTFADSKGMQSVNYYVILYSFCDSQSAHDKVLQLRPWCCLCGPSYRKDVCSAH